MFQLDRGFFFAHVCLRGNIRHLDCAATEQCSTIIRDHQASRMSTPLPFSLCLFLSLHPAVVSSCAGRSRSAVCVRLCVVVRVRLI